MQLPKTRKAALALGLPRYFTGKPCPKGHIAERDIKGSCLVCKRQWDKKHHSPLSPEKNRENSRRWRENNLETARARARKRYALNPQRGCEIARKWQKANPKKHRALRKISKHKRRARLRGADGFHTAADIERITKAQNGRCACCGTKTKLTVDHIQPITKNGSNWPNNLQMLCGPCNNRKRTKDPITFMQERGCLL